jgi:hypothetical protein
MKDSERKAHALIKGTEEGEMIIKSEKPHLVGGKRVVIDKTRNNKNTFKKTEEGEIE